MTPLDELSRLEAELRAPWDGWAGEERKAKVHRLFALREELAASLQATRRRPLVICWNCLECKPTPYGHPRDKTKPVCKQCIAEMQYAQDYAASRDERRIGDAGERAALRAGRMTRGGR